MGKAVRVLTILIDALAFGAVLLLAGRLSDIYGHKLFFMGGLAWFSVWSIATGFAPNEISIDIFRAMQVSISSWRHILLDEH